MAAMEMNKNKEDLISVVVPVYNVQEYLEECINSLLEQSYQNLELILVDDGSTDKSGAICDAAAGLDNRIRVIHQGQQGLARARNKGLDLSLGAYIAFVDSDDYVSERFLQELFTALQQGEADISVCDYVRTSHGGYFHGRRKHTNDKIIEKDADKMLGEWHGRRKRMETVVWNKLYRRKIFGENGDGIRFVPGKKHEDILVTHLFIQRADKVAIIEKTLYAYRKRRGSITGSRQTEADILEEQETQRVRLDFFLANGYRGAYNRLKIGMMKHEILHAAQLKRNGAATGDLRHEIWRNYKLQYEELEKAAALSIMDRFLLMPYRYFPKLITEIARLVYGK